MVDALLTPDGQHIIAAVTYNSDVPVTADSIVGGIVQMSITSCQLTSVDPTGDHLLVSCSPDKFGRLDRARFTSLPIAGSVGVFAATW